MSDTPADDAPAPADDNGGPGIDADAFSPVIDPDYVPGEAPKDDAAKDHAARADPPGSEAQPDRENPEGTGA